MEILIYMLMIWILWVLIQYNPKRTISAGVFCLLPLLDGDPIGVDIILIVWFLVAIVLCFWRELGIGFLIGSFISLIAGRR